jgi:hypothetical protein
MWKWLLVLFAGSYACPGHCIGTVCYQENSRAASNGCFWAGTEHSLVIGGAITHTATSLLASRVRPRSHDSRLLPRR